ncbi:MAG: FkbM family methyltransferase [Pseudomonadota bacterium]
MALPIFKLLPQLFPFARRAWFHGLTVTRDPSTMPDNIWKKIRLLRYEKHELRGAQAVIEPGDRVLELGAGLGLIGAALSHTTKAEKFVALEGNPQLFEGIRKLHAANGITNIELRNVLAMPTPKPPQPFYLRDPFWASSMDADQGPYTQAVEVETVLMSDLLAEIQPQVITCDIEGAEVSLFTPDLDLTGVRAVIMELHERKTSRRAVKSVFDALSAQGFAYHAPYSKGEVITFLRVEAE